MMRLESVTVRRGERDLLRSVSVELPAGRVTVLIGPNGAGKSTLLKVASGAWSPTSGAASLHGHRIDAMRPGHLAALRAFVAQSAHLSFPFTVEEVVALGVSVPGFGRAPDPRHARDALAEVGLQDFRQRNYLQLSGGERQRVQIARALCQLAGARNFAAGSQMLLLDEPTASLDPAHQTLVMCLCRKLARDGLGVVVVLHDLNLAAAWADEIVLMSDGGIVASGVPSQVITDDMLTKIYGWRTRVNAVPPPGGVFVLPHYARG